MRRGFAHWRFALGLAALAFAGTAGAQELHKNEFSGKATQFVKGDDNVKAEVKVHELSADRSRSLPTSEHIKLNLTPGKKDSNFAYYFYPTPVTPLNEDTTAELWVHSNKAGVQLLARVVFPKIRNPKQIDESLTRVIKLDDFKPPAGGWQKLMLKRPADLLQAQKQALRLDLKDDPDVTDAYIDRLILNLHTGPGEIDVYIDNLEIGPIKPGVVLPKVPDPKIPGKVVGKEPPRTERGLAVEYERGKLTVGGVQAFPRFIRYSGTPMQALREAGFNSLYMPADTPPAVLEDAIQNYRFWIIPHIPPIAEGDNERGDQLIQTIRKFQSGDGVLFWDLGAVRSEDYRRAARTVEAIRSADPRRPVGADVWDGFGKYAIPLQLVGTHRDPLMTTLELDKYALWLRQRRDLAIGSRFTWTWIQTHVPDWQARLLYGASEGAGEPIGPQPEQIRLLTYLAIASGCKGLGYWSDKYLADSHQGRERLLQLALLNQEIEMFQPLLLNLSGNITWVPSSNPSVKVAVLRTIGQGVLALPIWLGGGAQYVPPQAAAQSLTFTVPLVPDGAEPWEITPVRVQSLQNQLRITPDGVQITLPEFDLTAAVVFTCDTAPDGLIAQWQKQTRALGPFAASWAVDLAEEQFKKVVKTQARLQGLAPPLYDCDQWIGMAKKRLMEAKRARVSNNDELAYFDAIRALRPLRILMRAQWDQAVRTLDFPGATPYAVSYHTLPKHWELAAYLHEFQLGGSVLPNGSFDAARPGEQGVAVTALPGWTVQEVSSDEVELDARIVVGETARPKRPVPPIKPRQQYAPTSLAHRVEPPVPPEPPYGACVLRLRVTPKPVTIKKSEKPPPEPQALERVFLCVNSPPVQLPPGSWVRITGWVRVPTTIRASADGVMFFDSMTGEPYAARVTDAGEWKHFHTYRQVPDTGEVRVRMALTGIGTAYFDDVRVEPYVGSEGRRFGGR